MLVAELGGTIRRVLPPYTQIEPTPFLQITNIGTNSWSRDFTTLPSIPISTTNHYIYVTYTLGSPNHDRLSRFTVNATLRARLGTRWSSTKIRKTADADHHGGAIMFGNDGKIYFTTGDDLVPGTPSQDLNSPRGKILRINPDGTVPTDNPFYDGAGPHYDAHLGAGAAQSLPRLLRRADRPHDHR